VRAVRSNAVLKVFPIYALCYFIGCQVGGRGACELRPRRGMALFGLVLRSRGLQWQQSLLFYMGGFVLPFFFRPRQPDGRPHYLTWQLARPRFSRYC
jgi:hypothetical protein